MPGRTIRIAFDLIATRQIDRIVAAPCIDRMGSADARADEVIASIAGNRCI